MKVSQKMPLNASHTMVHKSQKWPKTQIKRGGGGGSRISVSGSCWVYGIIIIKQIHTFTSNILFEQRHLGLGCPKPWLDKGWGNPDQNVVAQRIRCWWMCGFAWWLESASCAGLPDTSKWAMYTYMWLTLNEREKCQPICNWKNGKRFERGKNRGTTIFSHETAWPRRNDSAPV